MLSSTLNESSAFNLLKIFKRKKATEEITSVEQPVEPSKLDIDPSEINSLVEAAYDSGAEECPVSDETVSYGVDVSYPIHHPTVSSNYAWSPHNVDPEGNPTPEENVEMPVSVLPDRQELYDNYMQGCFDMHKERMCRHGEKDRIDMNFRQPASMQNYTKLGFQKIRAPAHVFKQIKEFWDMNHEENQSPEKWPMGNIYTNHWDSPTTMLSVEDETISGGGPALKNAIWETARDTMQEWTGEELSPSSLYGIRVYHSGAILAPHVDRMPLVTSAIINVAQDVDEPWPIEVYAHDGKAYNITMEPGDMVLYESHSVIHGRPFALKGRFYANVFIHFEPTGHTLRHEEASQDDPEAEFEAALKALPDEMPQNDDDGLPPYIVKGSQEEIRWRQLHPEGKLRVHTAESVRHHKAMGATAAHGAAAVGDLEVLTHIRDNNILELFKTDINGWQPIHEAARGGNMKAVQFLFEAGADINARTNGGNGGSVLWWAMEGNKKDSKVVLYLQEHGAISNPPE